MQNSKVIKAKAPFILYLVLWLLYSFQDILNFSGIIAQAILFTILAVSLYYFILVNVRFQLPKVLRVLNLLLISFTIYGFISIVEGGVHIISESGGAVRPMDYLKNIYVSFLPIYVTYYATRIEHFDVKDFRVWAIILLVVSIIKFYSKYDAAFANIGFLVDDVTNGKSYDIVFIIVLLPLFDKRPLVQYVILAVCVYFAIIGMKRGAMVCGAVAMIVFILLSMRGNKGMGRKLFMIILASGIIFIIMNIINHLVIESDWFSVRIMRTMDGNSSGRDDMYNALLGHFFNENNVLRLLFGNGADATFGIAGNYAHNDWLEIAINNGLVMLVLYFIYWVLLFRTTLYSKKIDNMCFKILLLFFTTQFLRTFFSMGYSDIALHCSMALGFVLATIDNNKYHKRISKKYLRNE